VSGHDPGHDPDPAALDRQREEELLDRHMPEASPRDASDLNPRRDPPLDFPDKELAAMKPGDYQALGFLGGLEVHQQLATRGKLFCRCPSGRRASRTDARILRHMRPTLSELGKYDACALMEFKTRKDIVYLLERDSVCTYELDDTPPFPIDDEAVDIALEVSLLFGLNLASELHVMRKQYLDGSIPTGFQRTALTGVHGRIPFRVPELGVDRELTIRQISLEEDSCREVRNEGHRITFLTDRLGTPLTETVTEPELLTAAEMAAAARLLARTVQATGRVRRGPGAARQDVNVSIAGSRRVELKGIAYHRGLERLVHVEAFRQLNLLRIAAELGRRGVTAEMLAVPQRRAPWAVSPLVLDATGLLAGSDLAPLEAAIERGGRAGAVRLRGFAGLLRHPTQPGLDFSHELAERVRVIACLGATSLIHTDDADDAMPGIDPVRLRALRAELKCEPEDAVVLVWGPTVDVATAAREVLGRCQEALLGVPSETRQPLAHGRTGFERLLPGPERMYPDTDTPPIAIADPRVQEIDARRPDAPWTRSERYRGLAIPAAAAARLATAPWAGLFDALAPAAGPLAGRLATALEKRLPALARSHGAKLPAAEHLKPLVDAVGSGTVRLEALEPALDRLVLAPDVEPQAALRLYQVDGREEAALALAADMVRRRLAELRSRLTEARLRWAMGVAMPGLIGRVDPKIVREALTPVLAEGMR
jgi:glutamyl-tRNA(Gln) amidotransferase subunit E